MTKKLLLLILITPFIFSSCLAQTSQKERHLKDLYFVITNQAGINASCINRYEGRITNGCIDFNTKRIYISTENPKNMPFLLFHEVGHYLLGHSGDTGQINFTLENEADNFALYYLSTFRGFTEKQITLLWGITPQEMKHFREVFK